MRRFLPLMLIGALVLGACSSDDSDSASGTTSAPADLDTAIANFCSATEQYVDVLDQYGKAFSDDALTVGQLSVDADELADSRDEVESAIDEVEQARDDEDGDEGEDDTDGDDDSADATTSSTEGTNNGAGADDSTEPTVSDESMERVESAESDFDDAVAGIDDDTPVEEAGVTLTSAAYQLEIAWSIVYQEAGCLGDDESSALDQVRNYVSALQTDLSTAGFYTGNTDGVYGPETVDAVKALQADAGLPETGLMDPATQKALQDALEGQESAQVAALQGVLALFGYYDGPIDGQWSQQTEDALKALQTDLGVEPTGEMNEETLRALQDKLEEGGQALDDSTSTTTAEAPETTTTTAEAQ